MKITLCAKSETNERICLTHTHLTIQSHTELYQYLCKVEKDLRHGEQSSDIAKAILIADTAILFGSDNTLKYYIEVDGKPVYDLDHGKFYPIKSK